MVGNRESYLNLWRAVIGLTTVDGIVTDQEREWINKFMAQIKISDEERAILEDDIQNPKNAITFIDQITEASHLSQLHHLANIVFKSDDFDHKESVYLDKIHKHIETRVDLMCAMRKSQDVMAQVERERLAQKKDIKGFFLGLAELFRS
ncbi:DUF533 domain-containing protein [Bacteriovorax sp. DB6_IX]|uniref:DUF533 domain-containing protein n=1 Tax=Bacteriovorax sp. DB6_IX TaxID=1353530 RepID=UPI00038A550B|nr:DUF533 domain-containing protein [Bacteriovorax sp. DB6_IX]EQC52361.1 PF04391 domain protein [Bacteriovorax sp. DB6_IX]